MIESLKTVDNFSAMVKGYIRRDMEASGGGDGHGGSE